MAKPISQLVKPVRFGGLPNLQMQKFVEGRVNIGMNTMLDPASLPNGALQLAKNAVIRFDRTERRPGTVLLTPVKPNSAPVLKLAFIKRNDGVGYTVRMTPTSVHTMLDAGWQPLAGTLHGDVADRIQSSVVLNDFVFSNNGADPIQKIDFAANTFANLGNAPAYRFICGFYNRVVGAALRDQNEVQVGWSGDGLINQWDPAVEETAGFSPITESPSDLSDFITGIFAFTNVMVLLRERSVWMATKQPIPTQPFNFFTAVSGIGCDSPFSAVQTQNSITWLDRRTGTVWNMEAGAAPTPIGRPIEATLLANVDDPAQIFAAYNPIPNEYNVCLPQVGSPYVLVWTFNFRTHAWTRNEYYAITSIDDTELGVAGISIDQLGDVPINELTGTIQELTPSVKSISTRVFGMEDGQILVEDSQANTDAGRAYETIITSKAFNIPEDNMHIAQVRIDYVMKKAAQMIVEYSRNGGATDDSWKEVKRLTPTKIGDPQLLVVNKTTNARRFAWRLRTTGGNFELLSFEIHVYPSGISRP